MKRLFVCLLALVMLLCLAACGKGDAYAGTYRAISCTALGMEMDCQGDRLELKGNGKGKLHLMGDEFNCSWSVDGNEFLLKNRGDEFNGTLRNGVITLDYGDMIYVYVMPQEEDKKGNVRGHTHVWADATCEKGRTCGDCGAEEGEPLGHDAKEANYQDSSVCKRCKLVLAEKLQADMEKYGITEFMELGVAYQYVTETKNKDTVSTTGELTITDYDIFTSAEGYPEREGYEWRVIKGTAVYFDNNADRYGSRTNYCYENYYSIDLYDDSYVYDEESELSIRNVSYHGEELPTYYKDEWTDKGWKYNKETKRRESTGSFVRAWQVPVGYDGIMAGFYNEIAVDWEDRHIYEVYDPEHFWLFRLD